MLRTIHVAGGILAQGVLVERHADGRITISTGSDRLTGYPVSSLRAG